MIKNFVRKKVKKFLENKNFVSDYILYKNKIFHRKIIKETKSSNLSSKIFKSEDLQKPGEKFLIGEGLDKSINLKKMNSVAGYIPYINKKTEVVINNFFSRNYSIRKNLLGCLYFVNNSKMVKQSWFLLPVDCVRNIDLSSFNLEADFLVIELFHEKIPFNHGGHDGHLRFHGKYSNNASTVHSMPILNFYLRKKKIRSTRRYFPKFNNLKNTNYYINLFSNLDTKSSLQVVKNDLFQDYSKKTFNYFGYSLIEKQDKLNESKIISAFHDANISEKVHHPKYNYQLIEIPDIKNIDATLYFTEAILEKKEKIKIHFFSNNLTKKEIDLEISKKDEVNLKSLYCSNLDDIDYVIVEFLNSSEDKIIKYINIFYYIDGQLCDNAHAHELLDTRCLNNELSNIKEGFSGLKWMHFPNQLDFVSILTLYNFSKGLNFKLRINLENFEEHVIMYTKLYGASNLGKISINLRELFKKHNISLEQIGIVQLECKNYNPPGYLFTHSNKNKTLSVDHLTGG